MRTVFGVNDFSEFPAAIVSVFEHFVAAIVVAIESTDSFISHTIKK